MHPLFPPAPVVALSCSYPSLYGVPLITHVDTAIFTQRYFTHCLQCTFCHDSCCAYGVMIDGDNVQRLQEHAPALEAFLGIPRERWLTGEYCHDAEMPSGVYTRTQVVDGACVFLNRQGRGCQIHAFCLAHGLDPYTLKPMLSSLFPLTFDSGVLRPSFEVQEASLICLASGPTLFEGARNSLQHYFGEVFLQELTALAALATSCPSTEPAQCPAPRSAR